MRIIKTDRGYIDFDHVLHIGEPYKGPSGLFGFDITLAFRDKALPALYYPEDLGTGYLEPTGKDVLTYEETQQPIMDAVAKKRDEYVALWRSDTPELKTVLTYYGKQAHELGPDERFQSIKWVEAEWAAGNITHEQLTRWRNEVYKAAEQPIPSEDTAGTVVSLRELISFVSIMHGKGPDCDIPETMTSPLGIEIKLGNIMRAAQAASPSKDS